MHKILIATIMLTGIVGCSINIGNIPEIPEVIQLKDGTYKVFVTDESKQIVVKASKGMMEKTCESSGKRYAILSQDIQMTGEVRSSPYKKSAISIFGVTKSETEYTPQHMHEGEFHFECTGNQSA